MPRTFWPAAGSQTTPVHARQLVNGFVRPPAVVVLVRPAPAGVFRVDFDIGLGMSVAEMNEFSKIMRVAKR